MPALFVPSTSAPTHPGRFRSVLPIGDPRVGGAFLPDVFGTAGRQAIEMAFGADLAADPETWIWYDVTRYVQWNNAVSVVPGRLDEGSQTTPTDCGFVLRDDAGDFNGNNIYGAYYPNVGVGVPVRCRLDVGTGWSLRFQGETDDMTPGWDTTGNFAYVSVSAKGVMHRIQQGNAPLRSALYRATTAARPTAYWSLEDGADTTYAAGTTGNLAVLGDVTFGSTLISGASGALDASGGGQLSGLVGGSFSATGWQVEFSGAYRNAVPATEGQCVRIATTGTAATINLVLDDSLWDGLPHHVSFYLSQSGADIAVSTYRDGVFITTSTLPSVTLGIPSRITVNPQGTTDTSLPVIGHIAFFGTFSHPADRAGAAAAYVGETATDRLARLCAEEGLHIEIHGESQQNMGAQSTSTLMNALRECEAVDNGLLYDGFGPGLSYTNIDTLYNAGAALTLDATAGQVLPPFNPANSDQRVRNRYTASRPSGSSGQFEVTGGRLGTGRIRPYDSSVSVAVEADDDLGSQASWRARLGTAEAARYPQLHFNLAKSPTLAPRWLTTRLFQRVDVANVDDVYTTMPALQVQQVLQGYSERWNSKQWELTCNLSQWEPYQVAVYDTSRYASDGSYLNAAVTTTATTWVVTTPSGPLWRPTPSAGAGISAPWVGTSVSGPGGGTSTIVDISGATDGEWVFVAIGVADSQTSAPTAPVGWAITGQVQEGVSGSASSCFTVYQRKKQTGDTTFSFSWPTTRKFEAVVLSWPGLDATTPVESVATLAHSAASASYVTNTVTPTAATRWIAMFSLARGATALETFTADAAMTERVDANHGGTSPFTAIQVADTNAAVTAAGHTYTATCSQADPNGSTIAFALIPASTTPGVFTPYDLWCDGEQVTVTDIQGSTNPQTFTVTRSVNGIVKAHKDYREVTLYPQPRYAL
jgi:hypothetical protein